MKYKEQMERLTDRVTEEHKINEPATDMQTHRRCEE